MKRGYIYNYNGNKGEANDTLEQSKNGQLIQTLHYSY